MGALYADLDYYRVPELSGFDPRHVLELALKALVAAAMPEPTLAISSGRGLYLLWLHSPIPRPPLALHGLPLLTIILISAIFLG